MYFLLLGSDTSVIDEQSRWYKLHPHDPKKYPSHSQLANNEGAIKMARLNNPNNKNNAALYLDNEDVRKVLLLLILPPHKRGIQKN